MISILQNFFISNCKYSYTLTWSLHWKYKIPIVLCFMSQDYVEMRVSTWGPFHWGTSNVSSCYFWTGHSYLCSAFSLQDKQALYGFAFLLGQGFTTCWSCQSFFRGFNLSMRRTDSGLFQKASIHLFRKEFRPLKVLCISLYSLYFAYCSISYILDYRFMYLFFESRMCCVSDMYLTMYRRKIAHVLEKELLMEQ